VHSRRGLQERGAGILNVAVEMQVKRKKHPPPAAAVVPLLASHFASLKRERGGSNIVRPFTASCSGQSMRANTAWCILLRRQPGGRPLCSFRIVLAVLIGRYSVLPESWRFRQLAVSGNARLSTWIFSVGSPIAWNHLCA